METDEVEQGLPFQLQFDKPVPAQVCFLPFHATF